MFNVYTLYLNVRETGDVIFSNTYNSYNKAKNNIESFLEEHAKHRGKKIVYVGKEELEKLKTSTKKTDTDFFVKKKKSEAIIYCLSVSPGRIYNSYSIKKYGNVGISEFSVKVPSHLLPQDEEEELSDSDDFEMIEPNTVSNYEHGTHVTFISELKSVLQNRRKSICVESPQKNIDNSKMEEFIADLVNGKEKLNHITPPPSPKLFL